MKQETPSIDSTTSLSLPEIGRRHFLKAAGLSATTLMFDRTRLMAGPFDPADFDKLIPADKKLSKAWINSLYTRGNPLSATGSDLKYIGMPINGICTGQVYLGGDGKLWYWNLDGFPDVKHDADGPRYLKPDEQYSPMDQGFALQVGGKTFTLDKQGFKDVTFTNQYPMAKVAYADPACPLAVELESYTPYIPLNRDDSGYPLIVMRYTLKNTSGQAQEVAIAGWIENYSNRKNVLDPRKGKGAPNVPSGPFTGTRLCRYNEGKGIATVECWAEGKEIEKLTNFGATAIGIMGDARPEIVQINRSEPGAAGLFEGDARDGTDKSPLDQRGFGAIGRRVKLQPGEEATVSFTVSWRFPNANYVPSFQSKYDKPDINFYSTLWPTASAVAGAVANREEELYGNTKKWVDTWYDSTLPYWLLERAFIPINTFQTQNAERLALQDGFYNLDEGVNCCPGNCTHVWHYGQAMARIFPVVERECRDKVEYGKGFRKDGGMSFRHSMHKYKDAVDGHCGTILRVLRESQMTTDLKFLESIWERTKLSMDFVIKKWDPNEDGMLQGAQHNTLDEPWHGQVQWLNSLYYATLRAAATMARQMNQASVAERYEGILAKGAPAMVQQLWNEDFGYFIHIPGEGKGQQHGSTKGCHIDQVIGEWWLLNLGMDPILPKDKVRSALKSLWKYNFTPDVGAFRKVMTNGRWYAAEGDAGLVMTSYPFGKVEAKSGNKQYAGYLNECMTGFEWQVAAHMIWEGMTEEGLAIGKAIYDRYLPKNRNPYNEIECSDHYGRAMSSYSAFMAACGYRYDGPAGKLGFGPKLQPEDFRAAFTTAEGWGRFSQKVAAGKQSVALDLHYGKLALNELSIDSVKGLSARGAKVTLDGREVSTQFKRTADSYQLRFPQGIQLKAEQRLIVSFA